MTSNPRRATSQVIVMRVRSIKCAERLSDCAAKPFAKNGVAECKLLDDIAKDRLRLGRNRGRLPHQPSRDLRHSQALPFPGVDVWQGCLGITSRRAARDSLRCLGSSPHRARSRCVIRREGVSEISLTSRPVLLFGSDKAQQSPCGRRRHYLGCERCRKEGRGGKRGAGSILPTVATMRMLKRRGFRVPRYSACGQICLLIEQPV